MSFPCQLAIKDSDLCWRLVRSIAGHKSSGILFQSGLDEVEGNGWEWQAAKVRLSCRSDVSGDRCHLSILAIQDEDSGNFTVNL